MPFSLWVFWEGVSCPYFSSINYLLTKPHMSSCCCGCIYFLNSPVLWNDSFKSHEAFRAGCVTHFANSSILKEKAGTSEWLRWKWKPFWLRGVCVCIQTLPFSSFPHFTHCHVHWEVKHFSKSEKPCQNHALKESSVLSAACSMLVLQFLRVSKAFLTTFFYQNMPMCRYYNKIIKQSCSIH